MARWEGMTATTITMPREGHKKFLSSDIFFLLTTIFATIIHHVSSDDAAVMANLAKSLIPSPPGWTGPNYCKWDGITCDISEKVTSINLESKSLSGTLPSEINQLSKLKFLRLQRNKISGPVPALSNLASLQEVNLDENGFDSVPTGFLSGLTSLQSFSINNCSSLPPWTIPITLKDSTALTDFIASKANLVGEIPDIFYSLPNMQNLRLSYNNMTGELPGSFAQSGIQNLYLNNQVMGFSGWIDVLEVMTNLKEVRLQSNQFSGPIPDLSGCTELTDLQLRNNLLTGVIPDSLTKLPNLQTVALQSNKFQGPIPSFATSVQVNLGSQNSFCLPTPGPCDPQVTALLAATSELFYPMDLAESWEGNDACKEWKGITCEKGSVTIINFGKNNWIGTISPAYGSLTNLKSLLLNDNKLVGTIPKSLTSLQQLQVLDITNNNISGKVPSFPSSVTLKLTGNPFIGKDVPIIYPGGRYTRQKANGGTDSSLSPGVIVVVVLVILIVIIGVGFVIYQCYFNKGKNKYKWISKGSKSTDNTEIGNNNMDHAKDNGKSTSQSSFCESNINKSTENNEFLVYDGGNIIIPIEVLLKATDNFNEKNIAGRGGFGIVYKGQLQDGTKIAVKRMEASMISDKGLTEFKAEIEVLTKVRHRNLVSLHGFCNNGNERLLVYEYMTQGSLNEHLFEWKEMGVPALTWDQRVLIALDVARGVEYLHSMVQQSFIHRDLKPQNILLGDDMRAKVSDFGLVRSAPEGNCSIETRLAGTFGYLAPEYAVTGRVTTKVDVYAFGVILMEIITGRRALDGSLPDERSQLVTWFRPLLQQKDSIKEDLDPTLRSDLDEETFEHIWKVAELAGHCTTRDSAQRPDMSHAVNVLSSLVEQWKPAPIKVHSFGVEPNTNLPSVLQDWQDNADSPSILSSDFFNPNTSISGTKLHQQ